MDKQALQQHLSEIAENEVFETMNLMPEIRAALERTAPPKPKHVWRLANVAAATAIFAFSAAAVYAVYQEIRGGDPGLEAVNADNQIIFFDETHTVEGGEPYDLAVTLDYAYADANRITASVTANGMAPQSDQIAVYLNPTLTDDAGNQYVWLPVGGGGGGGGGSSNSDELVPFSTGLTANFDASLLTDVPEELNLHLLVEVAYTTADDPMGMIFLGATTFDFTLPLNPGRVMDTPQTAEADSMDMTLQKVVVAPSLTRIELCYETTPENANWVPFGRLEIGGEVVTEGQFATAGIGGQPIESDDPCRAIIIPDALQDREGEWQLTIEGLVSTEPVDQAVMAQLLVERYGIPSTPQPDGGFSYDRNAVPEGVDVNAAFGELFAELQPSIEGPWVFNFVVPE